MFNPATILHHTISMFDFRYFHMDKGVGNYTCGFARDATASLVDEQRLEDFLIPNG